jgi:hypothetical protein
MFSFFAINVQSFSRFCGFSMPESAPFEYQTISPQMPHAKDVNFPPRLVASSSTNFPLFFAHATFTCVAHPSASRSFLEARISQSRLKSSGRFLREKVENAREAIVTSKENDQNSYF